MSILKKSKKGQIAMEYLAVFSITLLMTLPMIIIFIQQSNSLELDVIQAQIGRATNEIVDAAEEVSYMGQPAKKTIRVTIPKGIEDIYVDGRRIFVNMSSEGKSFQMIKESAVNLTGDIDEFEGRHILRISAQANDVSIEEQ